LGFIAGYNVVACGDQTDEENSEKLLVRILNASSSDSNSRSKDVFESDICNLILLVKFAKKTGIDKVEIFESF